LLITSLISKTITDAQRHTVSVKHNVGEHRLRVDNFTTNKGNWRRGKRADPWLPLTGKSTTIRTSSWVIEREFKRWSVAEYKRVRIECIDIGPQISYRPGGLGGAGEAGITYTIVETKRKRTNVIRSTPLMLTS
jgi:hypothetical protein